MGSPHGFTLLEVLIVIAVIAVLSVASSAFYRGYLKSSELDITAKQIVFDLRRVRSSSMTGENDLRWGVHFVNSSTYYYQIFSSPTVFGDASTTIDSITYLPKSLIFVRPITSSTLDIIFDKIRGTTVSSTITIYNPTDNMTRDILVNAAGNIY